VCSVSAVQEETERRSTDLIPPHLYITTEKMDLGQVINIRKLASSSETFKPRSKSLKSSTEKLHLRVLVATLIIVGS
jgi:hypothetical protein